MFDQMSEHRGSDKSILIMNHHTFEPYKEKMAFSIISGFSSNNYPPGLMIRPMSLKKERNDGRGWRGKGKK